MQACAHTAPHNLMSPFVNTTHTHTHTQIKELEDEVSRLKAANTQLTTDLRRAQDAAQRTQKELELQQVMHVHIHTLA